MGTAPPESPVPAPRATKGTERRRTRARRCGRRRRVLTVTAKPGTTRYCISPSHSYVASSTGSVMSLSAPITDARRSLSRATAPGAVTPPGVGHHGQELGEIVVQSNLYK